MTADQEWDLIVPDVGALLLDELRRRGVRPGQRLHVVVRADDATPQDPEFFASFDGPPDLATRSRDILEAEFPQRS